MLSIRLKLWVAAIFLLGCGHQYNDFCNSGGGNIKHAISALSIELDFLERSILEERLDDQFMERAKILQELVGKINDSMRACPEFGELILISGKSNQDVGLALVPVSALARFVLRDMEYERTDSGFVLNAKDSKFLLEAIMISKSGLGAVFVSFDNGGGVVEGVLNYNR